MTLTTKQRTFETLIDVREPARDSLIPLLGRDPARRSPAPRDDRIVDLSFHQTLSTTIGWDVLLDLWWDLLDSPEPPADTVR